MRPNLPRVARRAVLGGALALCTKSVRAADPGAILDDASRLSATPVARHVVVAVQPEAALLARLRAELRDAREAGRPVAMGAARHSMGGQSLAAGGTALTFPGGWCEPDRARGTFRAGPGTRWREVIATLDRIGYSPAVMQSNHDFGVASTYSVNAHGWPVPYGPFGATVRRVRMLLADGSVVDCSRQENAELFGLAMGGYGLFGVVLEIEAAMVPNRVLRPHTMAMAAERFGPAFVDLCTDPSVTMAYGRLDVSSSGFLQHALMIGYRAVDGSPAEAGTEGPLTAASRALYRAQTGFEAVKQVRWLMEAGLVPRLGGADATRNALLNEPVANLAGDDPARTDILHEYFIPPAAFPEFLSACRAVIPASRQELLNVTLRFVDADPDSRLAYAPGRRIAAVMSFTQRMTDADEADMRGMTRVLVDRVIALGGSFYLPYRLHATREQMARAYPGVGEVAARKRHYDPGMLFRNALWEAWLG